MLRIKKDDQVVVIAGKDKGKQGKVIRVQVAEKRAIVEGINVVKKARKKTQHEAGAFIEVERPIHISNIMLLDKKTGKPTRIGAKVLKDGSKVRVSKKSGEVI